MMKWTKTHFSSLTTISEFYQELLWFLWMLSFTVMKAVCININIKIPAFFCQNNKSMILFELRSVSVLFKSHFTKVWLVNMIFFRFRFISNKKNEKYTATLTWCLTMGMWKEPRVLSIAIVTPEEASPMITGDSNFFIAAQPKLEPLFVFVCGWPFTNSKSALSAADMSLLLSQMWKPNLRCGRRSLRRLISLIANVMVFIQRKALKLRLFEEKQFITEHHHLRQNELKHAMKKDIHGYQQRKYRHYLLLICLRFGFRIVCSKITSIEVV